MMNKELLAIRARMQLVGMTRRALAKALHMSYPALTKKLAGDRPFRADELTQLARLLARPHDPIGKEAPL